MTGLVFEGGGVKGAYQIGAYYAFKKCGIKFDGVVGTSIGAFNAAMIVTKKEKQLLRFWQKANIGKILGLSDEYTNAINSDKTFIEKTYVSSKEIVKILRNKGVPIEGLKTTLHSLLTEDEIRNSKMDYGLATVRANGLKPMYVFKEDIPKGQLLDYIVSSCYLPVFKREKMSDGNYYLDGGFYDKSPSNMLEMKDYDKIYVVSLNSIGVTRKKINKSKIITITPSHSLGSILNVNNKEINYNIKLGFYDTIKRLRNLDGYKYIFKSMNNEYYNRIIKHVDKKSLKHIQRLFLTNNSKELIIRCLEHILKKEKKEYVKIYNPRIEILKIKLSHNNDAIYHFIKKLGIL